MRVTAEDFIQNYRRLADGALTEPLTITQDGADHLVVLSAEEYGRLRRRGLVELRSLTEGEVVLIAKADVPSAYGFLDEELKDAS